MTPRSPRCAARWASFLCLVRQYVAYHSSSRFRAFNGENLHCCYQVDWRHHRHDGSLDASSAEILKSGAVGYFDAPGREWCACCERWSAIFMVWRRWRIRFLLLTGDVAILLFADDMAIAKIAEIRLVGRWRNQRSRRWLANHG